MISVALPGPPPVSASGNVEAVELAAGAHDQCDEDDRPQQRQRNEAEALPGGCAVDRRGLVKIARHGLQAAEHHHHREGNAAPRRHRDEDGHGQQRVGEPRHLVDAEEGQHIVGDAQSAAAEYLRKDQADDHCRQDPGQDGDRAQQLMARQALIQDDGHRQRDAGLKHEHGADEGRRVAGDQAEVRPGEEAAVICQADELRRDIA